MMLGLHTIQCIQPSYSVFPRVEKMLEESEFQAALKFIASRKKMDRYHDMIDFLLCETFQELRHSCFKYYRGNGPRLIEVTTKEQREKFEIILAVSQERCGLLSWPCQGDSVRKPALASYIKHEMKHLMKLANFFDNNRVS